MLEVGSGTKFQLLPLFHIVGPLFGSNQELGGASRSTKLCKNLMKKRKEIMEKNLTIFLIGRNKTNRKIKIKEKIIL